MRIPETTSWRCIGFATAFLALLVIGGCASSNQSSLGAVAPVGVDLTGTWEFNEVESDSTGELGRMMRSPEDAEGEIPGGQGSRPTGGMSGGRPTGGMGGIGGSGGMQGGRGGMSGGRGGGMPQGSRVDPEKMRRTMELAMDPKRKLTIAQSDTSVSLLTEWQHLALRFGGDGIEEEHDWGKIKTSAGWVGYGLVVEREVDGGGKVLERYVLSPDSNQLFVVTRVEMGRTGREPIEFRRVYDPVEP